MRSRPSAETLREECFIWSLQQVGSLRIWSDAEADGVGAGSRGGLAALSSSLSVEGDMGPEKRGSDGRGCGGSSVCSI